MPSSKSTQRIIAALQQTELAFCKIRDSVQAGRLANLHPRHIPSATNLFQYLWLRRGSIASLQQQLHNLGLSSLASAEGHIHRQIQEVLLRLQAPLAYSELSPLTPAEGSRIAAERAKGLFGRKINKVAFMVTLDSKFADDVPYMEHLLQHGMNLARINLAQDDTHIWGNMLNTLSLACRHTGKSCKVYMDLAGPKFRVMLPAKGRQKGRLAVKEGDTVLYADPDLVLKKSEMAITTPLAGIAHLLHCGSTVMIDDGAIEAVVETEGDHCVLLRITRISGKPFIRAHKGINFPNLHIPMESLTPEDIGMLDFVRAHADLVGYSFVRTPDDLRQLQEKLYLDQQKPKPALIIKVETPEAVQNLPELILQGMQYPHFGVMIARGDLAVEIGFERLSEIQEEILWICEAAHTPVIWATQVLESLNKTGMASRSEITDAYKAAQAECIMINKGKFTVKVLDTLHDLISRSHRHHYKKRYAMDALGIAEGFFSQHHF